MPCHLMALPASQTGVGHPGRSEGCHGDLALGRLGSPAPPFSVKPPCLRASVLNTSVQCRAWRPNILPAAVSRRHPGGVVAETRWGGFRLVDLQRAPKSPFSQLTEAIGSRRNGRGPVKSSKGGAAPAKVISAMR